MATITADEIREHFSQEMSISTSRKFRKYGTLLVLLADVNLAVLENNLQLHEQLVNVDELARLNVDMALFALVSQNSLLGAH